MNRIIQSVSLYINNETYSTWVACKKCGKIFDYDPNMKNLLIMQRIVVCREGKMEFCIDCDKRVNIRGYTGLKGIK